MTSRISPEHAALYRQYHAAQAARAARPSVWLPVIEQLAERLEAGSLIDYGCGIGRCVSQFSRFPVADYDPGLAGCDQEPAPADLVVCIHTLEHIEPDRLGAVLEHVRELALKAALIVVSCEASTKLLPNGAPWHSLVRSADWWRPRLGGVPLPILKAPGLEYAALWRRDGASA